MALSVPGAVLIILRFGKTLALKVNFLSSSESGCQTREVIEG
jgi:hypothetical protein